MKLHEVVNDTSVYFVYTTHATEEKYAWWAVRAGDKRQAFKFVWEALPNDFASSYDDVYDIVQFRSEFGEDPTPRFLKKNTKIGYPIKFDSK